MSLRSELERVRAGVDRFTSWHREFGDLSWDRMDFWGSSSGQLAKRVFYRNKLAGAPLAAVGLLLENFLPRVQKLFASPHREVIGDAHLALGYLSLHRQEGDRRDLDKAEALMDAMLEYSTPGYSGLCWGYSYGWETGFGFWPSGIPLNTITPYAFWAFRQHFFDTGATESRARALSIAEFALQDLKEVQLEDGTWASSYSPTKVDVVVNASSYRAAVLLHAWELSGDERFRAAAARPIEFLLSNQGEEGEWYYEAKGPANNFIDHFHTCFVLRNLTYALKVTDRDDIRESVRRGYAYYRAALFQENGRPRHFAVSKYPKMRRYEMYDYAESIKLGVLLRDEIPGALDLAIELANDLVDNFQTREGYFVTRVTSLGTRHTVPYLRWPQAQLFAALTYLLEVAN